MSAWATPERLLELLTASPQYADSVADRLADLATTKAPPGQVDLLWRIAGYLFRRRWETRAAAALALERVAGAVAPESLAQVLFGVDDDVGGGGAVDGDGGGGGCQPPVAAAALHRGGGGLLLLSLGALDLGRVLRDGEPLLASTGEEFSLDADSMRGSLSREELEAQKRAILCRLGLEVQDAEARRALEIGGGGLDGFGIQEADLAPANGGDNGSTGGGGGRSSSQGRRHGTRKRKLGEMASGSAAESSGGGGGGGGKAPAQGRRGRSSSARGKAAASEAAQQEQPEAEAQKQQQAQQAEPWLAEHLSVRLFDAGWEARHGAALGLTALFRAWRGAQRRRRRAGGEASPWTRRWAEDVAGRCLCLLALDRFGDFSMGMGGAVAPIREVAGQLLALVVMGDHAAGGGGGGGGGSWRLLEQALGHLQTLAAAAAVAAEEEQGAEEEDDVRPWEVRHGAFVGLKYLVALPSEPVRAAAPSLLCLACGGLHDATEDVRNAAATTLLSLLLLLPSTTTTSSSSAGAGAAIDLPAILLPVFRALLPLATTTDAAGAAATAVDAERGSGATRGGESGATAAAAAAAVYLPTFLRLASSVLDRVLPPAPAIDSPAALLRPFGSLWTDDKAPRVEELWAALWVLAGSAEPGLRAPALNVLARVLSLWTHTRGKGTWARAQERAEALAWDALRALKAGRTGGAGCKPAADPELVQELEAVWTALGTALGATRADALAAQMADDWLSSASSTATLFPPATAAAAAATGAGAEDWGARRRTAAALAKLGPEVVGERALEALRVAPEAAAGADEPVARERAALLVGQCLAASGPGGSGGDAPAPQAAAQAAALQAALAEGLAALSQDDGAPRRVAVVAAAGLVGVGAASESPGPVMRALMEAVKAEADRERQGMAVDALVALVAALLAGDGKGRKAVEKAAGNLCVLACAMQQDDPARAMARGGAREALKGLMDRLGPGALDALPVLWPRIVGGLQGGGVGEAAGAEEAVRLLMVITPVAAEEGAALASIRSLAAPLVGLAIGAGAGVQEEEEEEGTSTTLVSLLASRCLVILLKRGRVGALAAQAGPLLNRALRDRGREAPRQRAAHCLLELAKALRSLPPALDPAEARAALPALLPPALATVADDDPEVRTRGAEAFRLLVELAPLLPPHEWTRTYTLHDDDGGPGAGPAPPVLDAAEARARESVMLLVLGGKGKGAGTAAVADAASSFAWPAALPGLLRGGLVLRPYQWEGVRWLTLLRRSGLHGALCDDMGLGKTLQALVALAVARCEATEEEGGGNDEDNGPPSLVLCPASLSGHWLHEARRFLAPHAVEPLLYRAGLSRPEKEAALRTATGRHLVIASYDLLRRDVALFAARPWALLLLDEAHVLRAGAGTALGRAVRRLRAAHRVALTGTPLQNQVQDVWAVFDLLMPGLLGDRKAFEREYGRPIGRATLRSATADATAEALARLDRLHAHLLPFLLRREKGAVLRDLPPKTITDLACDLVPLQREMYKGHCAAAPAQEVLAGLAAMVADEAARGGRAGAGGLAGGREGVREQLGARALRLLHYLRLLCVHPALVLGADSPAREHLLGEADCSGKMVALQQLLFACGVLGECREPAAEEEGDGQEEGGGAGDEEASGNGGESEAEEADAEASAAGAKDEEGGDDGDRKETDEPAGSLPKQEATTAAAAAAAAAAAVATAEGLHRCLIFAQHRVTLDAIERALLRRAKWNPAYAALAPQEGVVGGRRGRRGGDKVCDNNPRYLRLDGSVPSGQREALVQRFNADASIALMLLTTRVGGLGLNLTGADVVVFVEHDWNPAVDLQAMDRAHRIGQGRPVNVYRLVTQDTVEEQVLALQRRKLEMADAVVQRPGNAGRFEERGMAGVLDLVAASVGKASQPSPPQQLQVGAFGGGLLAAAGDGGGVGGDVPLPSEEPWDEGQYSGFAVETFIMNVLGVGAPGK